MTVVRPSSEEKPRIGNHVGALDRVARFVLGVVLVDCSSTVRITDRLGMVRGDDVGEGLHRDKRHTYTASACGGQTNKSAPINVVRVPWG